ncbi:hypothetical protein [uncultured Gimesia sp.]|uniref:hypothetical protein n=1 Tax=uncultured Gimesia sp. TaxID=1678688 RepID=UPI0026275A00|nr:hypothetical protein [uncultured Gimesia sp.]
MANEKAHQKNQLIYEFGLLIQPLEALANATDTPSVAEYRIAVAKVRSGDSTWRKYVKEFTTFAPDLIFNQEFQDISHVPERCWQRIYNLLNDETLKNDLDLLQGRFSQQISESRGTFFELIEHIPIEWQPVVFQANTPFTSYLKIKEAFVSVKNRLDYFDRYLKPDFFPMFLASVDRSVSIRLITTAGNSSYGVTAVAAVSRLAAHEFSRLQLIEVTPNNLHDRNLRIDEQNFTLGPGVDRAGMALTNFGPSDSSENGHRELDRIISNGRVVV